MDPNQVRLYLITREVRPDIPRSRRDIYKYAYKTHRLQLNPEVQEYVLSRYDQQLARLREVDLEPYHVIDTDEPRVVLFDVTGKEFSFMEVLRHQILQGNDVPAVLDINALEGDPWAYIFALPGEDGRILYTLNKISKGKIAVDERDYAGWSKRFHLKFNTRERRLEFLDSPTLSLEAQASAYYFDERFYIINKAQFEQIVGIEEEFESAAISALERVSGSGLVEGLDLAQEEITKSKRLLKRLAHLMVYDDLTDVTPARLEKMKEVAGYHQLEFNIVDDRVRIENKKDLDVFVRLLEDYYLKSPQTGHDYGSRVKRRIRRR